MLGWLEIDSHLGIKSFWATSVSSFSVCARSCVSWWLLLCLVGTLFVCAESTGFARGIYNIFRDNCWPWRATVTLVNRGTMTIERVSFGVYVDVILLILCVWLRSGFRVRRCVWARANIFNVPSVSSKGSQSSAFGFVHGPVDVAGCTSMAHICVDGETSWFGWLWVLFVCADAFGLICWLLSNQQSQVESHQFRDELDWFVGASGFYLGSKLI